MLIALIDEEQSAAPAIGASASAHVQTLVALMPFGVALVRRLYCGKVIVWASSGLAGPLKVRPNGLDRAISNSRQSKQLTI
jgi:hypothetical protein